MISVKESIVIERPVEEVFSFLANPDNAPLWVAGLRHNRLHDEHKEMRQGATGTQVRHFLGREVEATWKVVEFKQNQSITAEVTSGPLKGFHVAEATAVLPGEEVEHTVVTFVCRGPSTGIRRGMKLAEPVISRVYARQVRADVGHLKEVLESGAAKGAR